MLMGVIFSCMVVKFDDNTFMFLCCTNIKDSDLQEVGV